MRSNGVPNFPDPQHLAGGNVKLTIRGFGKSPAVQTALNACNHLLPSGPRRNAANSRATAGATRGRAVFRQVHAQSRSRPLPRSDSAGSIVVEMVQAQGIDVHSAAVLHVVQVCLPASHGWLTAAKVRESIANAGRPPYASACSRSVLSSGSPHAAGDRSRRRSPAALVLSSSQPQLQVQQSLLRFAACMRANGEPNFPDAELRRLSVPGGQRSRPLVIRVQDSKREVREVPAERRARPRTADAPHHTVAGADAQGRAVHARARRSQLSRPGDLCSVEPWQRRSRGVQHRRSDLRVPVLARYAGHPAFLHAAAACKFPLHNH